MATEPLCSARVVTAKSVFPQPGSISGAVFTARVIACSGKSLTYVRVVALSVCIKTRLVDCAKVATRVRTCKGPSSLMNIPYVTTDI